MTSNLNGTLTRLDFPANDFTRTPTLSTLGSGGFRGDLTQVGPDGCLYASQDGTRYDNGSTASLNSIVRICPGFAPPPGVTPRSPKANTEAIDVMQLGDSYSAGNGAVDPSGGTTSYYGPKNCYRSYSNWGQQYVDSLRSVGMTVRYLNRACGGATAKHLDLGNDREAQEQFVIAQYSGPNAATVQGNSTLQSQREITVAGGLAGNGTVAPAPSLGANAPSDPYAGLVLSQAPDAASGDCTVTGTTATGCPATTVSGGTVALASAPGSLTVRSASVSLVPGRYRSIRINGASTVVLASGTYYVDELDLSGGTLRGTGVTLVLTCGPGCPATALSLSSNAAVTLQAPSAGPLRGIALAVPGTGRTLSLAGQSTLTLVGGAAAPGTAVDLVGGARLSASDGPVSVRSIAARGTSSLTWGSS